ncbi:MAG: hypothetical protein DMG30_07435 [Acidobacteria bacterium]|nr:MAG: hypothetical protein DMG30_07435 [Acidobacteriota bacterium]
MSGARIETLALLFIGWPAWLSFVALSVSLVSCGGHVAIEGSDPPSCAFPNGSFDHVYVTIRSVQANLSASASDNSPGWQELTPQLHSRPKQFDLFSLASSACLLATLGNTALPAGTYQQIRLLLVPHSGAMGPLPATNACAGQGFNCVVLHDGSVHELQLSSQANTGLKFLRGTSWEGLSLSAQGRTSISILISTLALRSFRKEQGNIVSSPRSQRGSSVQTARASAEKLSMPRAALRSL